MNEIEALAARVKMLRNRHSDWSRRAAEVRQVRVGNFEAIAPDAFSDEFPRSIVSNMIDTQARHAAAALSPLPTITCSAVNMAVDKQKRFADKKRKIMNHYLRASDVEAQMQQAADQFYTYGLIAAKLDPNFQDKLPDIVFEDSISVFPVWDRKGRTVEVAQVLRRKVFELKSEYPELASKLSEGRSFAKGGEDREVDLIHHDDGKFVTVFVPECNNTVLHRVENPLGRCLWECAKWPSLDGQIRGRFDDLIWVQIARHMMQVLTLEATAKAVEAPLVAPPDVTELPFGPDAVIQSQNAKDVHYLDSNVPTAAWQGIQHLKDEAQYGAIMPQALSGDIDNAVVTGKGVQQLMAGYSQQVAFGQATLETFFEHLVAKALELDEKLWPNVAKDIRGMLDGAPYRLTYTPANDIDSDYEIEVTYGTSLGLDPNRQIVWLLQAMQAGLLSQDRVRRDLPVDIDPTEEEAKIRVEQMRESLVQGMSALVQSLPAMVTQGADPGKLLGKIAAATKELQTGQPIEVVLSKVFPPPEPQPAPQAPAAPGAPDAAAAGGAGGPGAFTPQAGAQATDGPGGRPSLQQLFAGLSAGGQPNLSGYVSQSAPGAF